MRTRRTMHGKRRRRSSLKFLGGGIGAIIKKIKKIRSGSEKQMVQGVDPNYAPTENQKYNRMEQASSGLSQKDMNIERDKQ